MYSNILVAVDGSEHSVSALKQAQKLARTFDASLTLMHAYPSTADVRGRSDDSILVAKRRETAQEVLDTIRGELEESGPGATEVLLEGPEAEAILGAAVEHKADLIVIGSRGLGAVKGWLLGSVSRKVSQHAECPVLIVK